MNDAMLVVIAIATVVMAVIQVTAIVFALRAARHVGEAVGRLERDIRPILANLQTSAADIARATTLAKTQVERADQALLGLSRTVDTTLSLMQSSVLAPFRNGSAVLTGVKTALQVYKALRRRPRRAPSSARTESEDAMFIG